MTPPPLNPQDEARFVALSKELGTAIDRGEPISDHKLGLFLLGAAQVYIALKAAERRSPGLDLGEQLRAAFRHQRERVNRSRL